MDLDISEENWLLEGQSRGGYENWIRSRNQE